ncbi:helix-turn-helix domain-containing protein, partial [Clostridium sp. HCS.1]|uniref:helix-turn-helix domain-containing protein n=1 Tax=Clostridium sp. HCS.1 TaxID=3238594 RepID=UPI003A0FEE58
MLARLQYIIKQFQFVLRTFFIDVYFFYLYNGQRKEVFALNERIKELRQYLHMSQEELGKWLGITKSGVSDIEACRR